MTDTAILYAGMFCLAFVLLGIGLTVYEFRRMSASERTSGAKRKLAYNNT